MSESTYCSPSSSALQIEMYIKAVIFPLIPIQEQIWNSFFLTPPPTTLAFLPFWIIQQYRFLVGNLKHTKKNASLQQLSASLQRECSCAASTVWPTRVQTDLWVNQCVRFLQWDYRFNLTKDKYAYQNSMTVIKRFSNNIPSVD